MRNLKKILAMVLALIMSLSLMATAGAADFPDADKISEDYTVAVDVLNGLGVFKGYESGNFEPQGNITRAEVAAIIYRIATGDVEDKQTSIYSSWGMFDDVKDGQWYAGYVNYCANAGYIKGYNNLFDPNAQVTGYQALAMILRAVGYDKMGEFTGSNWQVNTAATAQQRGVLKNVSTGLLGGAATREMIAEILFRAILINKVDYTPAYGYQEGSTSVGYDSLDLEEVIGVVVANEWADLYSSAVMEDGKTNLEVADGDVRTLNYGTEITDIGESKLAYIQNEKVLSMDDSGLNTVYQGGAAVNISTRTAFKTVSGLNETDETEYYVDFGTPDGHYGCEHRIEFNVTFYTAAAEEMFDRNYVDISEVAVTDAELTDSWNGVIGNYATGRTYHKIIRANEVITIDDLAIIRGIFSAADNSAVAAVNNQAQNRIDGDVYVGTKSTADITGDRDISNDMSYREFFAKYIVDNANVETWDDSVNGEWVKIIDNDADGNADYAFKTRFWLDTVVSSYTRDGVTTWEYRGLNNDIWTARYVQDYKPVEKDVVIYTLIDGMANIHKADVKTDVVNTVNFRDNTITVNTGDEAGKVWGQSGITNWTGLDQVITTMEELVSYNMYRDEFGYVRAFELTDGHKYGLISEIYASRVNAGQYVTDNSYSVEITAGDPETQEAESKQYALGSAGPFLAANGSLDLTPHNPNNVAAANAWVNYKNVLQRAIAHLGANETYGAGSIHPAVPSTSMDGLGVANGDEFNYGDDVGYGYEDRYGDFTYSYTNVARYNINTNDVANLSTVVEYAEDQNGNQMYYDIDLAAWHNWDLDLNNVRNSGDKCTEAEWIAKYMTENNANENAAKAAFTAALGRTLFRVYDVDYVPLAANGGISAGQRSWATYWNDGVNNSYAYISNNSYINAVHDTEFYIVDATNHDIHYFSDFSKVPAISADHIRSVYAVAENTTADRNAEDYWVANVIVIELYESPEGTANWDNVALVYYNPSQTTGEVRSLDALYTGSTTTPEATLIPGGYSWGREWVTAGNSYGFYTTDGDVVDSDGKTVKADIDLITGNWGSYGIKVGVVTRMNELTERGGYIVVDEVVGMELRADGSYAATTRRAEVENAPVYAIDGTVAMPLRMTSNVNTSNVEVGDMIIWVTGKGATVKYIIDLTTPTVRGAGRSAVSYTSDVWHTPSWLYVEGEERYSDLTNHTTNSIFGRILLSQRKESFKTNFAFYGKNTPDSSAISNTTGDIGTAVTAWSTTGQPLDGKTYVGSITVSWNDAQSETAWVAPNVSNYQIYRLNGTNWGVANQFVYPGIPDTAGATYLLIIGDNYWILHQEAQGQATSTLTSRNPAIVTVYTIGSDTKVCIVDPSKTLNEIQACLYDTANKNTAVRVVGKNADGVSAANMNETVNSLVSSGGHVEIYDGSTQIADVQIGVGEGWHPVYFDPTQVSISSKAMGTNLSYRGQYVYNGDELTIVINKNVILSSTSGFTPPAGMTNGTQGDGVTKYVLTVAGSGLTALTINTRVVSQQDECDAAAALLTGSTMNVTVPYSVYENDSDTAQYKAAVIEAISQKVIAELAEKKITGYSVEVTLSGNPSRPATAAATGTATVSQIKLVLNGNNRVSAVAGYTYNMTVTVHVGVKDQAALEKAIAAGAGKVDVGSAANIGDLYDTVANNVKTAVPALNTFEVVNIPVNTSGTSTVTMTCNYSWYDNGKLVQVNGAQIDILVEKS